MNNIFLFHDPSTDNKLVTRIFNAISNLDTVSIVYSETPPLSLEWLSKLQKMNIAILISDAENNIHPRVIEFLGQRSETCKIMKVIDKIDLFLNEHFVLNTEISYVEKGVSSDELYFALKHTLKGNAYISSYLVKFLLEHLPNRKQSDSSKLTSLTERETDVLKLIYKGNTHRQIATKLKIKYNTVCYYTKEIYSKMQVNSKNEAVYQGIIQGILLGNVGEQPCS